MGWNVYVTRLLPPPAMDELAKHCDVMDVNPRDEVLARDQLLKQVAGRDAVLCLLTDTIDDEVLAAAGDKCRIFANYAVGYNNVDVEAATKRGIMISNTPGVLTDATADMAWTLLFAAARRVVESDGFNRSGQWGGWGPMQFLGADITGRTLGVVGAGRIGSNFAKKSVGFRMKVLYADAVVNEELEKETDATRVDLDQLLRESDFVSIHVPLMPETTHLVGAAQLAMMKPSAILINTSRGPVVDEKALVEALGAKTIAAAGLDVYEEEPKMAPGLSELANVVVAPHTASATVETRTKMALIAVENIVAAQDGRPLPNLVNPEVLKK